MSEKTKVWIQTSLLDNIVFGKIQSSTKQAIPGGGGDGASVCDDTATYYSSFTLGSTMTNATNNNSGGGGDNDSCQNWGWSRGYIVNDDNAAAADESDTAERSSSKASLASSSNSSSNNCNNSDEIIKVCITDQESAHCNTKVTLPFQAAFSKGDFVMDNTYGDHHQHLYFDDSDDEEW